MTILLARMIHSFDMRLSVSAKTKHRHNFDGRGELYEKEFQVFDSVVAITDGPMIEFRSRLDL